MRFEVPQFIEIEDKIIGPLTWRQFVYVAGGVGLSVVLFLMLPFVIFILIGIPVMSLAGFLAFHKINNRPFSIFLESFVGYFTGSRLYLWKKEKQQLITTRKEGVAVIPDELPVKKSLSTLSRKLELNTLEKE